MIKTYKKIKTLHSIQNLQKKIIRGYIIFLSHKLGGLNH